jgi:hypothetical protein
MTPVRIQRKRTKGWRMPPNTIYVGRGSKWGNPFVIAPAIDSESMWCAPLTAQDAVACYREYLDRCLQSWPSVRQALADLRGKNLMCWCALDQPCHADVLLAFANADGGR